MTAPYDAWNKAIGQHFFAPRHAGQNVFLTVDEATLWQVSRAYGPPLQFASQEQAVDDFVTSVRREIRLRGWPLGVLRCGNYPIFLGFLALQILAVFKMREDEKLTDKAYWGRLRELLDDTTASYNMPLGLNGNRHQELWRQGLERWANIIQKECWGAVRLPLLEQPGEERDHVALPKAQALLTLADLYRLPAFYRAADFRPGEDLEVEVIQRHVEKLFDKPSLFGRHAQRVLRDDRRHLACVQIHDHLQQWDGDKRTSTARLWLQLWDYNPPELDGGLLIGDEPVPEARLGDVVGRSVYLYAPQRVFRPLRERYYMTVRDAFFGEVWDERRYTKPGQEVLLLVRSGEMQWRFEQVRLAVAEDEEVKQYHTEGEVHPLDSIPLRGLPRGWGALRFRVREDLQVTLPSWCEEWLHYARLQLIDGLRIGKQTWMAGAGPTVLVRASDVTTVCIDGHFYEVRNRRVTPSQAPCLDEPGLHIVQVEGCAPLKVIIEECFELPEIPEPPGWVCQEQGWPSPEWLREKERSLESSSNAGLTLHGPVLRGQPLQPAVTEPPVQRHWVEMVLQLRGYRLDPRVSAAETRKASSNPLIRQLQMIAGVRKQSYPGNSHD